MMNKLLNNKTVLVISTLALGILIGWWLSTGSSQAVEEVHDHESKPAIWTCSMHPQIRQSEPGKCPICGMELIPASKAGSSIDPMAVTMSPTAMQLASVTTSKVEKSMASKSIRLTGKVQADERQVFAQSSHIPGRVEQLKVNFTGEMVKKGQVIAMIYSPELVTAQKELLEAKKIKEQQPALFQAAKEKLRNWKLTDTEINSILTSEKAREQFPITADVSGYVTSKKVNPGDYIKKGEALYEIEDLSKVWVFLDVYESDLAWVNKGDDVSFTVESLPGKNFNGTISYIDPVVNAQTRVARARIQMANPDFQLKPEMFVNAQVTTNTGNEPQIIIPKSAVMWTGERSVVYVKLATDQGVYFKMREVKLGPDLGKSFVIKDGLSVGEEIATKGAFSIDAAAELAGKPSMMAPEMDMKSEPEKLEVHASEQTFEVNELFKAQLKAVFDQYLKLKNGLVASNASATQTAAKQLTNALAKVNMELLQGDAHIAWMMDLKVLKGAASQIASSNKIDEQRTAFSPLSDQLYNTIKTFQISTGSYRQFCPMAIGNEGAFWLSEIEEIRNPYFGDAMLTCGNVEEELK